MQNPEIEDAYLHKLPTMDGGGEGRAAGQWQCKAKWQDCQAHRVCDAHHTTSTLQTEPRGQRAEDRGLSRSRTSRAGRTGGSGRPDGGDTGRQRKQVKKQGGK